MMSVRTGLFAGLLTLTTACGDDGSGTASATGSTGTTSTGTTTGTTSLTTGAPTTGTNTGTGTATEGVTSAPTTGSATTGSATTGSATTGMTTGTTVTTETTGDTSTGTTTGTTTDPDTTGTTMSSTGAVEPPPAPENPAGCVVCDCCDPWKISWQAVPGATHYVVRWKCSVNPEQVHNVGDVTMIADVCNDIDMCNGMCAFTVGYIKVEACNDEGCSAPIDIPVDEIPITCGGGCCC